MLRSIRVRPDLISRVELALKHNGFLRQKDLVAAVGLAESTVRNFLKGKPVDYATFVEICQKLNLEWRDFADLGEISELYQESEEAVIARYSTSETEKTISDTLYLAEREEAIAKPYQESVESDAGSIEERIFKATNQLDPERPIYSRMSAIQALGKIANDDPRYHWNIMEILVAFIRENARHKEEEEKRSPKLPEDIQAALTVIGRRDPKKDPKKRWLNLRNTDIRGADLIEANLQRVELYEANLQGVDLWEANSPGVNLQNANLQRAGLSRATLERANLRGATLQKADLEETNLQGANLEKASLEEANFLKADLQGANLRQANLEEADLRQANLQGADFTGANLQGADFTGANLQGANLRQANLKWSNLYQSNLQGANLNHADLQEANLNYADLKEADLNQANLEGTALWRAELSGVKNLKSEQLKLAYGDSQTSLPEELHEFKEILVYWEQSGS